MRYRGRTDAPWNPPARGADVSALFALVVVCGPFLLPALGLDPGDFAFTAPLVVLVGTTAVCLAAARRAGHRRGVWRAFAAATALAAAASAVAVVSALANAGTDTAFYLGAAGSVGLLVAMLRLAHRSVRGAPLARLVDALLLDGVL